MTTWAYLTFDNGYLYCEDGTKYVSNYFDDEEDAETYLEENDLRASIR